MGCEVKMPKLSRRARWGVPAGVVAVTGAVMAGMLISTAQASPVLPARSAAQLLAAVGGRTGELPPLTGTVVETAKLGLPDLPGVSDPTSVASLLTGSHTIRIWYGGPHQLRIAVPGAMSESDIILNGHTGWYWQSSTNTVTKLTFPAGQRAATTPELPVLTPQQAAQQAIAAVGPTTRVSVQTNVTVAGVPAYQLMLVPRSADSLVGQVRIAIDATHHVPLRVQVYARHASNPAFQVGFTSISFAHPAAANFDFTAPPGAKVRTETLSGVNDRTPDWTAGAQPSVTGHGWLAVAELSSQLLSDGLGGLAGGQSSASAAASSAAQSAAGTPGASGVSGAGLAGVLLRTATPVRGAWGSGKLLRTPLLDVLMTSDGRVLLGAVTPALLYAAAAHAG